MLRCSQFLRVPLEDDAIPINSRPRDIHFNETFKLFYIQVEITSILWHEDESGQELCGMLVIVVVLIY